VVAAGTKRVTAANGVCSSRPRHLRGAVPAESVTGPVQDDHLAVEPVERPHPEVAVLEQLADGEVAVVGPGHERVDRRGLEDLVRLPCVAVPPAAPIPVGEHRPGPLPEVVADGG
jgi:hypothetical protein